MIENDKDTAKYISELEDKVVDLSLQLKCKTNQLCAEQEENYDRIRKLVHNLKNPIGVAYSFSEMIDDTVQISPEKLEKYIAVIKSSAKFSIDNLNTIANLNRVKSPNFTLNLQRLNFSIFIKNLVKKFEKQALQKEISIISKNQKSDLFLEADVIELEAAFGCILNNAIRYSPSNSTIEIMVNAKDKGIETKIIDRGIGIPKENLPNVFDEFFVVNTYSSDSEKCIGLGLSRSKISIEKHQGIIEIDSVLDKGTTVHVFIPYS